MMAKSSNYKPADCGSAQFSSLHAEDRQQRFGILFIEEQMNTFLILIILLPLFF